MFDVVRVLVVVAVQLGGLAGPGSGGPAYGTLLAQVAGGPGAPHGGDAAWPAAETLAAVAGVAGSQGVAGGQGAAGRRGAAGLQGDASGQGAAGGRGAAGQGAGGQGTGGQSAAGEGGLAGGRGEAGAAGGPSAGDATGPAPRLPAGWEAIPDWLALVRAERAAERGDTAGVVAMLAGSGAPTDLAWRVVADARAEAGDPAGALQAAAHALGASPPGAAAAAAAYRLGQRRRAGGDAAGARAAFRRAMAEAASSQTAMDAADALLSLENAPTADLLAAGRLYFRQGRAGDGAAALDAALARLPAPERPALRLEIARGLVEGGRYGAAAERLTALVSAGPDVGAAAQVLLARIRLRQDRDGEAEGLLRRALSSGEAGAAAEAAAYLGDMAQAAGERAWARRLYAHSLALDPAGPRAPEAAMRLGTIELAAGRYRVAAGVFDLIAKAGPADGEAREAAVRAAYWAAQAYLLDGDTAEAAARLAVVHRREPAGFYGLRAAEILGRPFGSALAPSPPPDDRTRALATGAVRRWLALERLGLRREAAAERDRALVFLAAWPDGPYALAEALAATGRVLDAIRLGRAIQAASGQWNERLLRIIYPLPYRDEIVAAARARGLDPFLIAGLIRQESMFQRAARSPAGAIGLMQLMPATAQTLARQEGVAYEPARLHDPGLNIRLGTRFIAQLLERHNGTLAYALAAYNAGPSRVVRWRASQPTLHPDLFAERIPFRETRDYVRIVRQNARIYAALYGDDVKSDTGHDSTHRGRAAEPGR